MFNSSVSREPLSVIFQKTKISEVETSENLWSCYPVAVPGIFVGDKAPSSSADRCHSLSSLFPPPAAVGSLPKFELATRFHEIRDFMEALRPRDSICPSGMG